MWADELKKITRWTRERRMAPEPRRLTVARYQRSGMDLNTNTPICQSAQQSAVTAATMSTHTHTHTLAHTHTCTHLHTRKLSAVYSQPDSFAGSHRQPYAVGWEGKGEKNSNVSLRHKKCTEKLECFASVSRTKPSLTIDMINIYTCPDILALSKSGALRRLFHSVCLTNVNFIRPDTLKRCWHAKRHMLMHSLDINVLAYSK